jgi:cytochrome b561
MVVAAGGEGDDPSNPPPRKQQRAAAAAHASIDVSWLVVCVHSWIYLYIKNSMWWV